MIDAVHDRAARRRRTTRAGAATALAAAALAASLIGGAAAPPAQADDDQPIRPTVSRISAADRYEMSATIAQHTNPSGAGVVYIASGGAFADALSAGPAAAVQGGPLLLVPPDAVPPAVRAELTALNPHRVVVVGGPLSVSDAAMAQVRAAAPHAAVERIAGADRYQVGLAVVADAFHLPSAVYLATGTGFADALTAGAVAGSNSWPVVLVDGGTTVLDAGTRGLIASLNSRDVVLVGGTGSISTGIEHSLPSGTTGQRIGGADRYEVSMNLNNATGADFETVYLATGASYPDALAGGVLAAVEHHPLYIVPPDCVPRGVLAKTAAAGTKTVVLLGGPASLGPAVEALTPCSW